MEYPASCGLFPQADSFHETTYSTQQATHKRTKALRKLRNVLFLSKIVSFFLVCPLLLYSLILIQAEFHVSITLMQKKNFLTSNLREHLRLHLVLQEAHPGWTLCHPYDILLFQPRTAKSFSVIQLCEGGCTGSSTCRSDQIHYTSGPIADRPLRVS